VVKEIQVKEDVDDTLDDTDTIDIFAGAEPEDEDGEESTEATRRDSEQDTAAGAKPVGDKIGEDTANWRTRYENLQKFSDRQGNELGELRKAVARIEGRDEARRELQGQPEVPDEFIKGLDRAATDDSLAARIAEDPKELARFIAGTMKEYDRRMAGILRSRDEYWENKLRKVDPAIYQVQDKIARLRQDADYGEFTDAQLATLIRKQEAAVAKRKEAQSESSGAPVYSGVPGSGRRTASNERRTVDVKQTPEFAQIWGKDRVSKWLKK
jgi:hypothetical protein